MFFTSPIWLALLLPPWAAVAVWLMWWRRGERTDVPFLALWRGGAGDSPRQKRQFRPPIALVTALAAALLAIVASARPGIETGLVGPHITVILDRGLTMSVGERRAEVVQAAKVAVLGAFGLGPTSFIAVPDGSVDESDRSDWLDPATALPPTQEHTAQAVQVAVKRALAKTSGPVIVLTDHAIAEHPRLVQIAPAKPLQNVAITNFVVRESPKPAAMVTVVNCSDQQRATLRVRSGERTVVERTIDLPRAAGGEASFFMDLPKLESSAAVAEIDVADDIAVDNVAHAKRQRSYPTIEIRAAVPPEVRRVAEAYDRARPPAEGVTRIAISGADEIPGDVPVAIVADSSADTTPGSPKVAAHPVSAAVDWAEVKPGAAGEPPGQNWRAVVSIADRAAVAVREAPHRQVWIGLHAPEFARTPDFVIFWANVFDWLAGGDADAAQHWASTVVPPVRVHPPPVADWQAKIATFKPARQGAMDVTSAVLLASVICLILAAVTWPGRSLTPFSAPLTV